jgi:sulfoxide reductase heme-binding subunit YedZ
MTGLRLVGIATAVVLGLCLAAVGFAGPGEDGIRAVIRLTARTSLAFFLLAFSASSAARLRPGAVTRWLLANRRYLGLSFASSHFMHLAAIVALVRRYPASFWSDTEPSAIAVGGIGYVFVAAMAATSNDPSVAWLGSRRWHLLHIVGAYWIWQIFLITYALGSPQAPLKLIPVALLLLALAMRVATRRRRSALAAA